MIVIELRSSIENNINFFEDFSFYKNYKSIIKNFFYNKVLREVAPDFHDNEKLHRTYSYSDLIPEKNYTKFKILFNCSNKDLKKKVFMKLSEMVGEKAFFFNSLNSNADFSIENVFYSTSEGNYFKTQSPLVVKEYGKCIDYNTDKDYYISKLKEIVKSQLSVYGITDNIEICLEQVKGKTHSTFQNSEDKEYKIFGYNFVLSIITENKEALDLLYKEGIGSCRGMGFGFLQKVNIYK